MGDMSVVGPRPHSIPHNLESLNVVSSYTLRHIIKPGITGWAQVNGRNAVSWEDKFRMDVWYVDHRSIWLDIKILWLTVHKVLAREGISAANEATMRKFTGGSP